MSKKRKKDDYQDFFVVPEDETVSIPFESLESSKFRNAYGRFQQLNYKDFDFSAGEVLELLPERDAPFDVKKNLAVQFADVYQKLVNVELDGQLCKRWVRRVKQVRNCNNYMETSNDRIYRAFFCKVRLCPLCSWRRSLKITMHVREILTAMFKDNSDYEFIFATFTIPNVRPECLKPKMQQMLRAWREMTKVKNGNSDAVRFNGSILGWYRGLEVTRNTKNNTYHPHFHCIFVVDKWYFKDKRYIKQAEWLDMWRRAMQDPTITQVDIRKCKPNEKLLNSPEFQKNFSVSELKALAIISSVTEAAKYTVKTDDYILSPEATKVLDIALERRQLIGFGGIMSEYRNLLKLDDEIDGDLLAENATEIERNAVRKAFAFHVGYGHYIRIDDRK